MEPTDHPFFHILFRATLALLASALVLIGIDLVYLESYIPESANRGHSKVIQGKSMQAAAGSARVEGDKLIVTGYERHAKGYLSVALWRGKFQADTYQQLSLQVDTDNPGPSLKLVWRTASDQSTYGADIPNDGRGTAVVKLARNPYWRGQITEIGLYALTQDPALNLSISRLTLEPHSSSGAIARHWFDWIAFRGWSLASINQLYGTVDRKALSPVVAAALWAGLALSFLLIITLFKGRGHPGAIVAVVLIPWISLDFLWQNELATQLEKTRDQFAGKSIHEKHLVDIDSAIYRYVRRLKEDILPVEPSRIVILHNKRYGHNFGRLKTQYYLLPNNVYNFGRKLPADDLQSIDYILALGDSPSLKYYKRNSKLISKGGRSLSAELVDDDPIGRLYRVLPRTSSARGAL
jgi:hypothetical protein